MKNNFVVYDFETCTVPARNPYVTQPSQLAALIVDGRNLEPIPGATFNSLMRPVGEFEWDEEALEFTRKKKEDVAAAPHPKQVWGDFVAFCKKHATGKNMWGRLIPVGHNIDSFDSVIVNRLIAEYGPRSSDGRPGIFHPIWSFDTMKMSFMWLHGLGDVESYSQPNLMEFFGVDEKMIAGAHDAFVDVNMSSMMLSRYFRLFRTLCPKIRFKGAFAS